MDVIRLTVGGMVPPCATGDGVVTGRVINGCCICRAASPGVWTSAVCAELSIFDALQRACPDEGYWQMNCCGPAGTAILFMCPASRRLQTPWVHAVTNASAYAENFPDARPAAGLNSGCVRRTAPDRPRKGDNAAAWDRQTFR